MPDGSSYDRDILLWSEQQADLLRRLSVGERPLYADALKQAAAALADLAVQPRWPTACPFTRPALLAPDADAMTLATLLTGA